MRGIFVKAVCHRIGSFLLVAFVAALSGAGLASASWADGHEKAEGKEAKPMVIMKTSEGEIHIELDAEAAPLSVENFLQYVDDGFYDGTVFHRVVPGFVIQGGGFVADGTQKKTRPPVKNEAENGLKNDRGTLSMARTSVVDSATSQFFVNLVDNDFLNHGTRDFGYAVFGRVTEGMDVVDAIAKSPPSSPADGVVIESAKRK
ncbi:MAG: peptidylprolyl isomerase A [Myxococcales bacterium]|nr:peptidylprolyl isomerase A [Myxococcales bacterium]